VPSIRIDKMGMRKKRRWKWTNKATVSDVLPGWGTEFRDSDLRWCERKRAHTETKKKKQSKREGRGICTGRWFTRARGGKWEQGARLPSFAKRNVLQVYGRVGRLDLR